MKVKFAGRVYDVKETRTLPGGLTQYGVEDEPGHIDWLVNVKIVDDGAGYGFKSEGASYPTKTVKFDGDKFTYRRLPFCDPQDVCNAMAEYDERGYDIVSLQPCSEGREYFMFLKRRDEDV